MKTAALSLIATENILSHGDIVRVRSTRRVHGRTTRSGARYGRRSIQFASVKTASPKRSRIQFDARGAAQRIASAWLLKFSKLWQCLDVPGQRDIDQLLEQQRKDARQGEGYLTADADLVSDQSRIQRYKSTGL